MASFKMKPASSNQPTGQPSPNQQHVVSRKQTRTTLVVGLFALIIIVQFLTIDKCIRHTEATSINYGISQRPITDISQLMPTLCQNQSVICEGSFCIPGLRRCVCDLRQPVQFGRFCLRQVDIGTKCFVSNQCNHTIKDAVCIDTNSKIVLDLEASKFKLEQWQQLNDLRQASKSVLSNQETARQKLVAASANYLQTPMFLVRDRHEREELNFVARDNVIISSIRNSPYEINYYTPELLQQNHTRRKTNSSDRTFDPLNLNTLNNDESQNVTQIIEPRTGEDLASSSSSASNNLIESIIPVEAALSTTTTTSAATTKTTTTTTTTATAAHTVADLSTTRELGTTMTSSPNNDLGAAKEPAQTTTTVVTITQISSTPSSTTLTNELSKKKMIVKTANWPPGVCSCPPGYMFDSMLRKCLALSLADSHCQSNNDCSQISSTHCSSESKRCECDEPLTWNQTELACQRPRPVAKTDIQATSQTKDGFFDNLIPPQMMAKIMPDQTMLLMIFIVLVIIGTLVLLRLVVKCFSSSNSALISPKNSKKRKGGGSGGDNTSILLPPKSPYATLRKPGHKPNTQLSSFTQATRGRILNYDFEQDNPIPDARSPQSPKPLTQATTYVAQNEDQQQHHHHHYGTLETAAILSSNTGGNIIGTLSQQKQAHKHKPASNGAELGANSSNHTRKTPEEPVNECLELNDNVSLSGHLDSESKSESTSVLAIPGPPSSQAPPYMLASAMKGQGSAIAAAAAAVANRRMQMAHKKNLTENSSTKVPNGTPVFL